VLLLVAASSVASLSFPKAVQRARTFTDLLVLDLTGHEVNWVPATARPRRRLQGHVPPVMMRLVCPLSADATIIQGVPFVASTSHFIYIYI
jgi:hypothetical protein